MGTIRSHRDLVVWQRSMTLVERCYTAARSFPPEEQFRLTSQLLRAAASVPANIAEGHARDSTKSFLYHLSIARGSLAETETFLLLAVRMNLCGSEEGTALLGEVDQISRMIATLQARLRARRPRMSPTRDPSPLAPPL